MINGSIRRSSLSKSMTWYESNIMFEFTHQIQLRIQFNNEAERRLTAKHKLCVKYLCESYYLFCSSKKLLVKFSSQHHAPMKIIFRINVFKKYKIIRTRKNWKLSKIIVKKWVYVSTYIYPISCLCQKSRRTYVRDVCQLLNSEYGGEPSPIPFLKN